uniref:Peptidase_M13 domain-containing protein n=1 Tax=Panagrellus redivivus TaxID=6233 RepID=A0A7E4VEM4_PANRE
MPSSVQQPAQSNRSLNTFTKDLIRLRSSSETELLNMTRSCNTWMIVIAGTAWIGKPYLGSDILHDYNQCKFKSCSIRPTIGHNQINNYPPETFRALAPLQNFKQYSAAFNCPKGAKMNPETKCSIW